MNNRILKATTTPGRKVPPSYKMRMRKNLQILTNKSQRAKKDIVIQDNDVQQSIQSDENLEEKPLSQNILRFRMSERLLHWAIALPFLVSYITALILIFYYNGNAIRPYREVFSLTHRISGVCLIVLPLLVLIIYWKEYKVYLDNMKEAWVWTFHDLKWLVLSVPAAIFKKVKLPDQDKFNAAEKINFMTITATYPLYIATGLFIWFSTGSLLSWFIHIGMALYATPILIGHKFMSIINPSTRAALPGMFSGYVNREWVKHHHTKWYWERFGSDHSTVGNAEDYVLSTEEVPLIGQVQGESLQPVRVTQETYEQLPDEAVV